MMSQYNLYKKKIFNSDIQLLGDNFDTSNYTVIIDKYDSNILFGKHFARLVVDSSIINDKSQIFLIFVDMLSKQFTFDCVDIALIKLNHRLDVRVEKDSFIVNNHCRSISNNLFFDIFALDHATNIGRRIICEFYTIIINIVKCYKIRKLHFYSPIPRHLRNNFCDIISKVLISNIKIDFGRKNTRFENNLEFYTMCTGLKKLKLVQHNKICDNFDTYQVTSQITKVNAIENLTLSISLIKMYPNILELFSGINTFTLIIDDDYHIDLLKHIINLINAMSLSKLAIVDLGFELWTMLENVHAEKIIAIYSECYLKDYPDLMLPCFDHITKINFKVCHNQDDDINYYINYIMSELKNCLTNNSVILSIIISRIRITDFRIIDPNHTYLTKLIERNLDLKINKLYKTTKAIVKST